MTDKLSMTIEQAREHMVAAIEEKGADYIYPGALVEAYGSCWYGDYGDNEVDQYYTPFEESGCNGPGCIVGHVLVKHGVPQSELYVHEGVSAVSLIATLTGEGDAWNGSTLARALGAAQTVQDGGSTWGAALEAFDRMVAELTGAEVTA